MVRKILVVLSLVSLVFVYGCPGSGGGSSGTSEGTGSVTESGGGATVPTGGAETVPPPGGGSDTDTDTEAPQITLTSPSNDDKDVSVSTEIAAYFTEAMAESSINTATFVLQKDGGANVEGVVKYTEKVATFKPSSALEYSAKYNAVVKKDVKDSAGNAMAEDYKWSFTTGKVKDTTPPDINSTSPVNGDDNVDVGSIIVVNFNEDIASISSENFVVSILSHDVEGGVVWTAVEGDVSSLGSIAEFKPKKSLEAEGEYKAVVKGVADMSGNTMAEQYGWDFKTTAAEDKVPPGVADTIPADQATGVGANKSIVIEFTEAMDANTMTVDYIQLIDSATLKSLDIEVSPDGTTATINPSNQLQWETSYKVWISGDVMDLNGNKMGTQKTFSFTTGKNPDTTSPSVAITIPADGETGVKVGSSIQVIFDEPIDPNFTFGLFETVAGEKLLGELSISEGKSVTFNPFSDLWPDTNYVVKIADVKDLASNVMDPNQYQFSFKTQSDITPPTIVSIDPVNGAADVAIDKAIDITFSEEMNPATIATELPAFSALYKGDAEIPVSKGYVNKVMTITPNSQLEAGATYKVFIGYVVQDSNGNPMGDGPEDSKEFIFTTAAAAADAAPFVSMFSPSDGATEVSTETQIIIYFSEAMNDANLDTMKTGFDFMETDTENKVSFTLAYDTESNASVLTPSQPLAADTPYTVIVWPGILTDLAGNLLSETSYLSFTTAAPDTVAPTVAETDPGKDATDVPIDKVITVEFSEEMGAATMVKSNFMLLRYEGGKPYIVGIDIEFDGTNKVSIKPSSNLKNSTKHTIYVNKKVMDLSDNVMAAGYFSSFTTVAQ